MSLARDGYLLFPPEPAMQDWARAAFKSAQDVARDPEARARNLRHGATWFVGVDALSNDADGAIGGVSLCGAWQAHVPDLPQHPAQLSIIYPGYPGRDPGESDGQHRFRRDRGAAHVDGLLPEGAARRRFIREPHAYILGIPLNDCDAAPTLVWPGSHRIIAPALCAAVGSRPAGDVDVTEPYTAARRAVFSASEPIPLQVSPGGCFLIHRHAVHGTARWGDAAPNDTGRMIAFLRPQFASINAWFAPN